MLIKEYAGEVSPRITEARYSPSRVLSVDKQRVKGDPDLGAISTSNIERSNLTMRMSMRRFTRLTNGFSKKRTNLEAAVALHFMWYSFGRVHGSIGTTPAVKAGIAPYRWMMDEIVELLAHQEPSSTRPAPRAA